jgi:hypothetical protein
MVGAEQPEIDVRSLTGQLGDHVLVHLLHILDAVIAASDSSLVGEHHHRDAGLVERGNSLN